ncbi:NAD(P)H-quinone oxidoreductase subunit H, chloroplastic [Streptomyces violaceorubidus]
MEEVSGGRMHYMFNRVGGLKEDLPAGWATRARGAVAAVRSRMDVFDDLVLGNEIFRGRTRGVGALSRQAVHAYGVSGPIARASGVDFDLRRDEPYLAYGELQDTLKVVTRTEGDCLARFNASWSTRATPSASRRLLDRLAELAPGPGSSTEVLRRPRPRRTSTRTRSASTLVEGTPPAPPPPPPPPPPPHNRPRRAAHRLELPSAQATRVPHRAGGADQHAQARWRERGRERAPGLFRRRARSAHRGRRQGRPTSCTRGFDGQGHGLIGMRERIGMVGGTLDAGPRPGGGFRISALLPLKPSP